MKIQKNFLFFIALVLAMLLGITGAQATLITNGGFETGTSPPTGIFRTLTAGTASADDIDGWIITAESIDWINSYWTPHSGTKSIDMSGLAAGTMAAATSFATIPGQAYKVSFWMAGNYDSGDNTKTVQVSVDGQSQDFDFLKPAGWSKTNMGWTLYTWTFIADDTSATLSFKSLETNPYGPALDDVSVTMVPLPSALLLLGSGLLGLAVIRRRSGQVH